MSASKQILLLSDTHGALHPEILSLAMDADLVVHAGDLGNAAVIESLQQSVGSVHCVLGNNDVEAKWPYEGHDILRNLPESLRIPLPRGLLVVEHGHRANPAKKRHQILRHRYPEARVVVYGHSHRLVIDRDQTPWIVNPGAAGRSRTFGGPTCVVLTISNSEWEVTPYRFAW